MAKSENSYRIRTEVGANTVLNVPIQQDIDFLEILSLKISQKGLYRLHASNYGVIVGRVLANDGFGVPNAHLSIFVELSDEDFHNTEIASIYPYTSIQTHDDATRRYNLLPDAQKDDCYRVVGTFPNKRLVLDNNTQIEIFDKYWKYTTVTNASGDYMIFGVPTGNQILHLDIDLSDIGVLSQKPRDFFYKGYNMTSFDNASQFKESTNLDNLVHIISQNQNVTVYPFWGDNTADGNIAITRADINVTYKFETTCVFMGSIASDNQSNSLGCECTPSKEMGYNSHLTASEGTIEMIRKTPDGLVEEYQIQGNQLINGDGVWCYQIPMNLDYVVTDEFGKIVPTNNPNKGIATRTSVRFRISVNETGFEGVSRHRAEYLVPNNPMPTSFKNSGGISIPQMDNWTEFNQIYEFGSATPDECFRDLYWNKVYSVKNYIPRLQRNKNASTNNYSGLRSSNFHDSLSPFPFNNVRFRFPFSYKFLCILMNIIFVIVAIINALLSALRIICIPPFKIKLGFITIPQWCVFDFIHCITLPIEDDEAGDGSVINYAPGCWGRPPSGVKTGDMSGYTDRMQRGLAEESEVVNLDFYNDWINGCLYMPLWFWKKTKKKSYLFGLIKRKARNKFCSTATIAKNLRVAQACSVDMEDANQQRKNIHKLLDYVKIPYGVIHEKTNKDNLQIYYYAPATTTVTSSKKGEKVPFIRLFATDIILLGSLADCDLDGYPQMFNYLPTTSANIPFLVSTKIYDNDNNEGTKISTTGMDWTHSEGKAPRKLAKGLILSLSCTHADTYHKSIINTRRLCELGVTYDGVYDKLTPNNSGTIKYQEIEPDGMITRLELNDLESRAMFATLNHNGLNRKVYSPVTQYSTYKLEYLYPTDFDGELKTAAPIYTSSKTQDEINESYIYYRFGSYDNDNTNNVKKGYTKSFPLYNNSFYFYFGITPGKTALEKFYTDFYAQCFNNSQEPFTASIETTPGSWCKQNASAKIALSKIRTPYSFEVLDSMGISFIEGEDLTLPNIKIDYWDGATTEDLKKYAQENFQCLMDDSKDEIVTTIANNGGFYTDIHDDVHHYLSTDFTNGMYTLRIHDAYGRTISYELNLLQSILNIDAKANDLSAKYEVGEPMVPKDASGKIIINGISIDGNMYRFKKGNSSHIQRIDDGVYHIYGFAVEEQDEKFVLNTNKESEKVILTMTPQNLMADPRIHSFSDTIYGGSGVSVVDYQTVNIGEVSSYGETFDETCGSIVFNISTADDFNMSAVMLCGDKDSDNTYEAVYSIENSDGLVLLLESIDTSIIKQAANAQDSVNIWKSIANPSNYSFPTYNDANRDWWNKYVEGLTSMDNSDTKTVMQIISYKLNSILAIANAVGCSSSQNTLRFSSTGGAVPRIYTAYPDYSAIANSNTRKSKLSKYVCSDSTTTIQSNANYPILVNANYYTMPTDKKISYVWGYNFNEIYKTDELANYAGIIDLNCVSQTQPRGISILNDVGTYNSMKEITPKNKYFTCHTVDKRADCDLYIVNDFNNAEGTVTILPKSKFFGGIAFLYDEKGQIVSLNGNTEYVYAQNDFNSLRLNYNKSRKYFGLNFASELGEMDVLSLSKEDQTLSTHEFPIFTFDEEIEVARGLTLSWTQKSCTYNIKSGVDENVSANTINIGCEIAEGESIDGTIGTTNHFKMPFQTMYDVAKWDYANVFFKKNKSSKVEKVFITYSISMDSDSSHSVYTNAPVLLKTLNDLESDYIKNLRYTSVNIPEDYKDTYVPLKDSSNRTKYVALAGKQSNVRAADDDSMREVVYYTIKLNAKKINQDLYPVVQREYFDGNFATTRLARKMTVYEVASVIHSADLRSGGFEVQVKRYSGALWPQSIGLKASSKNVNYGRICFVMLVFGTDTLNKVAQDEDGNYAVSLTVDKKDIYNEAYKYQGNKLIVPFYTVSDEDTESDNDIDEEDDTMTVSPVWYKSKKRVEVYIKHASNGLVYKFISTK